MYACFMNSVDHISSNQQLDFKAMIWFLALKANAITVLLTCDMYWSINQYFYAYIVLSLTFFKYFF